MPPDERDLRPNQPAGGPSRDTIGDTPVQRGPGGNTGAPRPRGDEIVDGAKRSGGGGVSRDAIEATPPTRPADAAPPPKQDRPPTKDLPPTVEKPGTGTLREPGNDFPYTREKQPVPGQEQRYPPRPERERPTGQITGEDGEYEPERTWYDGDGETDWNKVNRAPRTSPKVSSKQLGALAAIVTVAVVGAIALRPGASTTPTSSVAPASAARTNAAPTEPTGPAAQIATAAGYQCVGQQKALYDNSNGFAVSNGAASGPSFNTGGRAYCLVSMSTYHWNEGKGAGPGRVGLISGTGNVGPTQAQGTSGQGGAQNVNWVYVPDANARPLLNGDYTCYDSDRATWSQNDQSGHAGFCRVFVLDAVKQ